MPDWLDNFRRRAQRFAERFDSADAYRAHVAWAIEKHQAALRLFAPDALESASPRDIYDALKQVCLNVEALPFRITRIADANEADALRVGLQRLITTKGTGEDKMRAAGLRQLGEATLTELLCVYAPARFVMRSRPVLKGLVKLCELYTERHLRDMRYQEYADLVRELEKAFRQVLLGRLDAEEFYLPHKCLLACVFLAEQSSKGKRPYG